MNLNELKTQHPGLYEQIATEATQLERQRIIAALSPAGRCPLERYTADCIRNGSPLSDGVKARYGVLTLQAARVAANSEKVIAAVERAMGVK